MAVAGTEGQVDPRAPEHRSGRHQPVQQADGPQRPIWTHDYELLLDGPRATPHDLQHVADRLAGGGLFGYRMNYPAMRSGPVRDLLASPVGRVSPQVGGEAVLLADAPLGYLTAYPCGQPRLDRAVELWPRLLDRPLHRAAVRLFSHVRENHLRQTLFNVRKLLDTGDLLGHPLDPGLARQLLTLPKPRRWKIGSNHCRPVRAMPARQ